MPNILKLPAKLVNELGGYGPLTRGRKTKRDAASRKQNLKVNRIQKQKKVQQSGLSRLKQRGLQYKKDVDGGDYSYSTKKHIPYISTREPTLTEELKLESILKAARPPEERSKGRLNAPPLPPTVRRHHGNVAAKLAQDDAKIAALEKKLGIKNKKSLPQSFRNDGLDELLEGLDGNGNAVVQPSSMDQAAPDWVAQKRPGVKVTRYEEKLDGGEEPPGSEDEILSSRISLGEDAFHSSEDEPNDMLDSGENFEGFGPELDVVSPSLPNKRSRENPYIAPTLGGNPAPLKYLPPSLRKPYSDSEAVIQLRRQIQGLVNRLTEANLISIIGDVEKLYRENARQHVTSALVDLLLISVCEPTTLPDTLIILPAGFIAAIYKVVGTDFGAHLIERVVKLFDEHYVRATKASNGGPASSTSNGSKETSNLISLLAELYNFQVVGSNLVFDYIRRFLRSLSELNTELLLKIIRLSGSQLRQDDPSSLRDIVNMLRPAVANLWEWNLSVRTKFMIESINDLKNNRMKTGAAASAVTAEHTARMKKTLRTLGTRNIKATEPLRIGLMDIQEAHKRGKWWLVGARWGDDAISCETNSGSPARLMQNAHDHDTKGTESGMSDLIQIAREQRMNTDIRRAIFVTIMSASDFQDAYLRLMKLKLKKVQELEIPKVVIHCSSAEKHYNPYYTLVAKRLCGDRKLRMAFQFSLWEVFKRLGEANNHGEVTEDIDEEDILDTRQLVNLAKMFGALIVEGCVGLGVLKNLNLDYIQPKTKIFVEVLIVTVLLQSQQRSRDKRDEQAVVRLFSKVKHTPSTISGLKYFLMKVVAKTDIVAGKIEIATIKWASRVAASVLDSAFIVDTTKAELST